MNRSNLVEFKSNFEKSLAVLEQTPWLIIRLKQLIKLAFELDNGVEQAQQLPFRLELEGISNHLISEIIKTPGSCTGIDPETLSTFYQLFNQSIKSQFRHELEFLLAESWFNLGAVDELEDLLSKCEWFTVDENNENLVSTDNLIQFQKSFLVKYESQLPAELGSRLEGIVGVNQPGSSNSQIQGLFVIEGGGQKSGILADLTLTSLKTFKKQGADQLRIATHLVDEDDVLADQGHDLFKWLRSSDAQKIGGHLRLEYTLSEKSSLIRGSSLGLGLGLLGKMALYGLDKNPSFEPRVYSDVALTGALDANGNVMPVNEATLKYKIAAGFFSNTKSLIIPAQHQQIAEKILLGLHENYPLRQLQIITVKHIDELENHRDIFLYQRRRVSQRTKQFIREYANFVTVSILSFLAVLIAGFWFGIVKESTPFELVLKEKELSVVNKFGYHIWKAGVGSNHGVISDITNEGELEVVIGYDKYTESELKGYVVCYNSSGEILWKFKTGREVQYGSDHLENNFNGAVALIEDLNGDGVMEIVTIATHDNFPTQICLLSHSGEKISEYWHAGQLQNPRSLEVLSENRTKELVFCGINNEYRTGLVLVLDPFIMRGRSPAINKNYQLSGSENGNEIFYLKFPHTHFFTHPGYDRSDIVSINSQGIIRIKNSYWITLPTGRRAESPVFYVFNSNFNLLSANPGDKYYLNYKEFFTNRDPLSYASNDLIQYFSTIDYWNGESWQIEPTVNQIYVTSSKHK